MHTYEQDVERLVREDVITREDALQLLPKGKQVAPAKSPPREQGSSSAQELDLAAAELPILGLDEK